MSDATTITTAAQRVTRLARAVKANPKAHTPEEVEQAYRWLGSAYVRERPDLHGEVAPYAEEAA